MEQPLTAARRRRQSHASTRRSDRPSPPGTSSSPSP